MGKLAMKKLKWNGNRSELLINTIEEFIAPTIHENAFIEEVR